MNRWLGVVSLALLMGMPAVALGNRILSFSQTGDGTISASLSTGPCPLGLVSGGSPVVSFDGNAITIQTSGVVLSYFGQGLPPCYPAVNAAHVDGASLGKLADGTYSVVWSVESAPTSASFAVINGVLSTIYPSAVNGYWYDPAASGAGFNIEMQGYGLLVTYYGKDAAGSRLWLTSNFGPTWLTPNVPVTLSMASLSGGTFTHPLNTVTPWGTLVLSFTTCNLATATLSGTDGTVSLKLQHLVSPSETPPC